MTGTVTWMSVVHLLSYMGRESRIPLLDIYPLLLYQIYLDHVVGT